MKTFVVVVALAIQCALAAGQTVPPANPATPAASGAAQRPAQGGRVGGGANAAAAMGRPTDPNSPAQAGRQAVYKFLDDIATKDEAVRREQIAAITTRQMAELRQQEVRTRLLTIMGGSFARTPLNAKVVGQTQMDGFRIEKVLYESQPKFYVTALLYVPDGVTNTKLPAIVMAPGHASSGKAGDYAMATLFVRNGFIVLSYDPIGQGERLQYPDPAKLNEMSAGDPYPSASLAQRATGEHGEAGLQPTLIGDAIARYFAIDGIRAVDYLLTRPEVDPDRIGAEGCSGGGAMTALLGAADKRVKATATACYLTTMDALLGSIGAQDAEQSTPGFIAEGFDFADWVEMAAPRAYAMVGTTADMFPWKGFIETAQEARRFYSLFDPSAAGVEPSRTSDASPMLPTVTGPTLNPDTINKVSPASPFQVITGIGGHGNLRPIQSQIVQFFLVHLAGRSADDYKAPPPAAAGASPFALPDVPKGALQVTPTGQVLTSFSDAATVHSLNLERAKEKLPQLPVQTLLQVQTDIREVAKANGVARPPTETAWFWVKMRLVISKPKSQDPSDFLDIAAFLHPVKDGSRHPAVLILRDNIDPSMDRPTDPAFDALSKSEKVILEITPRPSPPGAEETKAAILGPLYLTELRAELVDQTLLGMRVDDVIRAVDALVASPDVDPKNITVVASGHMGLVALNAAVLDSRIAHVTVDHVLQSYRSLLEAPMPIDAPQDILPGVLEHYDIPDLVRVLGPRLTATDWLPGTADLSKH